MLIFVYYTYSMYWKLVLLPILSLCLTTLLCIAPPAYAAEHRFSQPLSYAGLTFSQPLLVAQTTPKPTATLSIGFALKLPSIKQKRITPTPTPTILLIATPTPSPSSINPPIPSSDIPTTLSTGGLDADKLFAMANKYRTAKGLPALQKDVRSCQLAISRAPEINAEIAEGHMHSGLRERNLSYWNTENIISYSTEEEAFNWWINDTIHREAIEGNYTYSCVACFGNSCAQEFTNYLPK
jgi:uncharacterized protein YkwD